MKIKYLTLVSTVVVSCLSFSSLYAATNSYYSNTDRNQSKKVVLDENYLKNKGKTSSINNVDNSTAPPHM
ncbi:hypothetical protein AB9G26_03335 [Francisella philomiragia]|uniref:hypothetical protein n=1 Tax=Francisella philomiragia TaxID=28110 RepID=UPI0035171B79